jgi:tetratricopeptide (TPR) repeat protein
VSGTWAEREPEFAGVARSLAEDQGPAAAAEHLVVRATALATALELDRASFLFEGAAEWERAAGRGMEESRALHLAATNARLGGDVARAGDLAQRCLQTAAPGSPPAVAGRVELAEVATAEGRHGDAVTSLQEAREHARAAGIRPQFAASLALRLGESLASLGRMEDAALACAEAREDASRAGDGALARLAGLREATALSEAGRPDRAMERWSQVLREAEGAADEALQAELMLLLAHWSIETRDLELAAQAVESAWEHAMDAGAADLVAGTAAARAKVAEALGDLSVAWEALLYGQAALARLLDPATAEATLGPALRELAARHGPERMAEASEQMRARRRGGRAGEGQGRTVRPSKGR